jgi:hypothetical protein
MLQTVLVQFYKQYKKAFSRTFREKKPVCEEEGNNNWSGLLLPKPFFPLPFPYTPLSAL